MEQDFMQVLAPGRIFFDYGPVSMVVTAIRGGEGDTELCKEGFGIISGCLGELRPALEELRKYPPQVEISKLSGTGLVMAKAVLGTGDPWLTPMAAVAGSVSDAVADYLHDRGAEQVAASNGGAAFIIAYVIIIFVWMLSCFILSFIQFIFIAVIVIEFTHNLTSLIKNKGECKLHSPKFSCSSIIFSWNFLLVLVQLLLISYQIQIHKK